MSLLPNIDIEVGFLEVCAAARARKRATEENLMYISNDLVNIVKSRRSDFERMGEWERQGGKKFLRLGLHIRVSSAPYESEEDSYLALLAT